MCCLSSCHLKLNIMKTIYIIIIVGLINFSCSTSRNNANRIEPSSSPAQGFIDTDINQPDTWLDEPNSSSSMIKVLNAATAFNSLPNGLTQMGFTIVENNGLSLTTNLVHQISDEVKVIAWVEGTDIILTSEVQQYTESEFGIQQPIGLKSCNKGNTDYLTFPDCWCLTLMIANSLEGEKKYQ